MSRLSNFLLVGIVLTCMSAWSAEMVTQTITLKATVTPPTCTITGDQGESQISVDFGMLARNPDSWARQAIPVKLSCDEYIESVSATVIGDSSTTGNLQVQGVGGSVEVGIYMGPDLLVVGKTIKVDHHQPLLLEAKPIATGKAIPSEGGEFSAKAALQINYH